jgi:REP element-mobilizing transposase RayT
MSYTRLRYHIITATKRRAPIITPKVEAVLYPALQRKAQDGDGHLLRIGGVSDHVHMVAALHPSCAVSDFVRAVKAGSSRAVRRAADASFRWQRGYAAFTLNPLDLSRILAYVARQKEHHLAGRLWAAYERLPEE